MKALLLIFAALATYGSVYPFSFETSVTEWTDIRAFLLDWSLETSRGNFIANILLFAPLGFAGFIASNHPKRQSLSLGLTIALSAILAFALQVAQLWIPGRNPAISDAIINMVGLLTGIVCAMSLKRLDFARSHRDQQHALTVPMVLVLLWVAYRWFPLVPTLDLQNIKNSLKPLLLDPHIHPTQVLANAAAWATWMFMLSRCGIAGLGQRAAILAAIIVVAMQPLFAGNTISINNVIGLAIAMLCMTTHRLPKFAAGLAALLLASLLASGLQPYDFSPWENSFHWLPFAGFLGGSMESNALSFIYKCYFYGSALYVLRLSGLKWARAATHVALVLFLIELAQIHLPGRSAEITDPLLALLIAFTLSRLNNNESIVASTHPANRIPEAMTLGASFASSLSQSSPRSTSLSAALHGKSACHSDKGTT